MTKVYVVMVWSIDRFVMDSIWTEMSDAILRDAFLRKNGDSHISMMRLNIAKYGPERVDESEYRDVP